MKLLLLFCASVLLSGCWQMVDGDSVKKGEQFCKNNEGLMQIEERFDGITTIFCLNGSQISGSSVTLTGE